MSVGEVLFCILLGRFQLNSCNGGFILDSILLKDVLSTSPLLKWRVSSPPEFWIFYLIIVVSLIAEALTPLQYSKAEVVSPLVNSGVFVSSHVKRRGFVSSL